MKKLLVFWTAVLIIAWWLLLTNPANINKLVVVFSSTMQRLSNFSDPIRTYTELGAIAGTIIMVFLWTVVLMRKTAKKI